MEIARSWDGNRIQCIFMSIASSATFSLLQSQVVSRMPLHALSVPPVINLVAQAWSNVQSLEPPFFIGQPTTPTGVFNFSLAKVRRLPTKCNSKIVNL